MGVRDDDYRYLKIVDAFPALNQKVNLIGIVVDFGVPKRSKGTDCFCSVRITDDSHQSRGLLVNIFAETEEKLPQIESSGDIIVLCHVVIKAHNKENYALYNKRFSSFALYEGKYGENFGPYQVSSLFRPREQDKKFVAGLRKVLDGFQLDIGSWGSTALLREIKEGEHADLVVKILHVYEVAKDEVMLFVWDGTDAPVLQMQSNCTPRAQVWLFVVLSSITLLENKLVFMLVTCNRTAFSYGISSITAGSKRKNPGKQAL